MKDLQVANVRVKVPPGVNLMDFLESSSSSLSFVVLNVFVPFLFENDVGSRKYQEATRLSGTTLSIRRRMPSRNARWKKEGRYLYGTHPMYDSHKPKVVDGIDAPVYEWMNVRCFDNNPYYGISSYTNQKPCENHRLKGTPVSEWPCMLFHKKFISNDRSEGNVTG